MGALWTTNLERLSPCLPDALFLQVNIDGYALPIKKLKGTDPVESLDLSRKELGPASAVVIASLIGDNGSLTTVWIPAHQPMPSVSVCLLMVAMVSLTVGSF